jgi:hypothetical protein
MTQHTRHAVAGFPETAAAGTCRLSSLGGEGMTARCATPRYAAVQVTAPRCSRSTQHRLDHP